ncbi:MAG: ATP-dependent sacrificial sulfur transferase LarE [Acidaminobacteraceae bacterium]
MIERKLEKLKEIILSYEKLAIGFSGGVDSSLLSVVASEVLGKNFMAITINGDMISKEELIVAKRITSIYNINHVIIDVDIDEIPYFKENPLDRCYYCKKALFTMIKNKALESSIDLIADGTNIDDLGDYRPGLRAIEELKVVSPLREAGLTKEDIRKISKIYNLETWNHPSAACLASRIPYGTSIDKKSLELIGKSEEYIKSLGFEVVRVRKHNELARIEIGKLELSKLLNELMIDKINMKLKEYGFKHVALDLNGYKMGSLNADI